MILEIHDLNEREALASSGCVIIRVIDGARTDAETIDRCVALIDGVLQRSKFAGMWIVINHGSPPPTMALSRYSGRVFAARGDRQSTVYSMLGIGFWAATARRTTSLLNRIMGHASSHIEDSVEAGARRLAMELVGVNSDELISAHEQVRARMLALRRGEPVASDPSSPAVASLVETPKAGPSPGDPSASMSRVGERSMIRRFRIIADHELCHGHGMCAAEAPELFRVVDDKVQIDDAEPSPKLWFKAEAAARYCPQFALAIEELDDADADADAGESGAERSSSKPE